MYIPSASDGQAMSTTINSKLEVVHQKNKHTQKKSDAPMM